MMLSRQGKLQTASVICFFFLLSSPSSIVCATLVTFCIETSSYVINPLGKKKSTHSKIREHTFPFQAFFGGHRTVVLVKYINFLRVWVYFSLLGFCIIEKYIPVYLYLYISPTLKPEELVKNLKFLGSTHRYSHSEKPSGIYI